MTKLPRLLTDILDDMSLDQIDELISELEDYRTKRKLWRLWGIYND